MNYIREINAFYDSLQLEPLSSGQILLWNALMSICNKLAWKEWFSAPSHMLALTTGMSTRSIIRARDALRDRGFIEVKSRGTHAPLYRLISCDERSGNAHLSQVESQVASQVASQDESQVASPYNKQKHKQKLSPNGDNNPPYPPTALDEAIERFKTHRKMIKKPMSDHAVDLLRKKLADMAADEETQIAILDQSIFNGWQGVFHLRDDAKPGKASGGGDRMAHLRAMYEKYERQERQNEIQ